MAKSMDKKAFWRQKLLQILHDPPGKPFEMVPGSKGESRGGHKQVAREIATLLAGVPVTRFNPLPDWAAAGADRPFLPGKSSAGGTIRVSWSKHPVITHPLCPGYRLLVKPGGVEEETAGVPKKEIADLTDEAIAALADEDAAEDEDTGEGEDAKENEAAWESSDRLQPLFLKIWRKLRHILIHHGGPGDADMFFRLLWQVMPADTRCPDHSIWEHTRLTSALAFITSARSDNAPRAPWLFRFEIGPVGRFIRDARTSRDLWMGSFLLSDLALHAMKPLVEVYGPDCILFPDLRENPLADIWLKKQNPDILPEAMDNPFTFAAVLPNTFTAVLPRGTEPGHLRPLEKMGEAAQAAVEKRWQELSGLVKTWLTRLKGQAAAPQWHPLWEDQQKTALHTTWSAVRWTAPERVDDHQSLEPGDALPAQFPRKDFEPSQKDKEAVQNRKKRLAPFVPEETWAHYNRARQVFARSCLPMLQLERGFEYALTHHQLKVRHGMRKLAAPDRGVFRQLGEKCTVCGKRQAIYDMEGEEDVLHTHRRASRHFWKHPRLNPDPVQQDRLCGVCATRRFLVEAGCDAQGNLTGINPNWAGSGVTVEQLGFDDNIPRVPFPSTATLAAQEYLKAVCETPKLKGEIRAVVDAWDHAGLVRTGFPRSLRRTSELVQSRPPSDIISRFLRLDTQQSLFPETLDAAIRREENAGNRNKAEQLTILKETVTGLRNTSARDFGIALPNTQIAVVQMDGDDMGRLLLGDRDRVSTTWEDVLHPEVTAAIQGTREGKAPHPGAVAAKWPDLLTASRLTGPAIHAFISRALGVFSHRIVPWVVEMEFAGRLIYSGGDDILAMVPASSALAMAARLQQLFSAPFVLDTRPLEPAWGWRMADGPGNPGNPGNPGKHRQNPRDRFLIPMMPESASHGPAGSMQTRLTDGIQLPIKDSHAVEPYIYQGFDDKHHVIKEHQFGEILPLLGKSCSLSAGIAIGHFKHPLHELLDQSRVMLENHAKKQAGKNSVCLGHFSRNGAKSRFVMPWQPKESQEDISNIQLFHRVVSGFASGTLPRRLPYKLNQYRQLIRELSRDQELPESFIKGLFNTALEEGGKANEDVREAALKLWQLEMASPEWGSGLLLARNLSALEKIS